jgi:putative transposase
VRDFGISKLGGRPTTPRDHLLREFEDHYNTVRPHQGLGNVPLNAIPLPATAPPRPTEVRCHSRLGGLIRHYWQKAA